MNRMLCIDLGGSRVKLATVENGPGFVVADNPEASVTLGLHALFAEAPVN